jgi:predicted HTH domain antitoxin
LKNQTKDVLAMQSIGVSVKLPRAILAAAKVKENELEGLLRESLAIELYRLGRVSLGKTAEIAGVSTKREMISLLAKYKLWLDYTAEDAEQDWETLKEAKF